MTKARPRRKVFIVALCIGGIVTVFSSIAWSTLAMGFMSRSPSIGRARVDEFALVIVSMIAIFGIARLLIGDARGASRSR